MRVDAGDRRVDRRRHSLNGNPWDRACRADRDTPVTLLVTQARSPMTRLDKAEILLQNRQGKGMPYLMAILDDIVTALYGVETVPDPAPVTNP